MSTVRLIPLGVGEAFSARHYTTSLAVGSDDDWLLLDCPHPIRKMLREASESSGVALDLGDIGGVALSHLHADHASGLEDYAYFSFFTLKRKAQLLAHPDISARIWPDLLAAGMDRAVTRDDQPARAMTREDYFDVIDLVTARPVAFGPFSIECRPTRHSIPATAFRVACGGRSIGFSADTAFDPTLIDWLAPCDLIAHEATTAASSSVHTPLARLAELPEPIRRKLRLIHYPDDLDTASCPIEMLRQGQCYVV
ncbi:MAG TPA: MBL fold metallo-hydrolase [Isosphaeraceae bacterium]|jgi:ribonuclease BN (tRNA processing enzyme)